MQFSNISNNIKYISQIEITVKPSLIVEDLIILAIDKFQIEEDWDKGESYALYKPASLNNAQEGSWLDPSVHLYVFSFENSTVSFSLIIILKYRNL